jgi:non-ribosomal peptide synthetase component E (peptide arylation enzyme)
MNKIVVFALLAAAIGCQPGAAETVHETCMILAFQDFNKANLALLREVPVMSVESALAQRRLEEQYCLRIVRCMLGDSTDQTTIRFKATFLSCLREESLQKYEAKSKDDDQTLR